MVLAEPVPTLAMLLGYVGFFPSSLKFHESLDRDNGNTDLSHMGLFSRKYPRLGVLGLGLSTSGL